jgi:G3E family GTPase
MATPLILLSGYLGAGKTTLLKHILKNTDKKIAVLMNEFGEVGIDTEEIKKENIAVKELLEGCVCCSLQGELEAGLKEIIKEYSPELIIVETTGIAEADNLVIDIKDINSIRLEAVITVVDSDIMQRFPDLKGSAKIQIVAADLLLLNKIDLVENLTTIKETLRENNKTAPIIETRHCNVDLNILMGIEIGHHHIKKSNHHHHMQSFSIGTKEVKKEKFESFLNEIKNVFRIKGYVTINNTSYLVNYVGGRWTIEASQGQGKLVFIGENMNKQSIITAYNITTLR